MNRLVLKWCNTVQRHKAPVNSSRSTTFCGSTELFDLGFRCRILSCVAKLFQSLFCEYFPPKETKDRKEKKEERRKKVSKYSAHCTY